jgi:HEPN domain-containing protein
MTTSTNHELRINDFAKRAFRDIADMDYIAARQSARAGLIPQFLWSSLQAFEKYLKYILLVNRISSRDLGHDISKSLQYVRHNVEYVTDLQIDKYDVFEQVAEYGQDRYLIGSYAAHGFLLPQLDAAIWDIRRYCQILRPPAGSGSREQRMFDLSLEGIVKSRTNPTRFKLPGGLLEQIVATKNHHSNSALCWQNAFFGKRSRTHVRAHHYLQSANAPLWLYPEMIDDLDLMIRIPKPMVQAYRQYRDDILSGKIRRP